MKMRLPFFAALALASSAALAEPYSNADLYYTWIDQDIAGEKVDGDGFGLRGRGFVTPNVFVLGQYQETELEDVVDFTETRAGIGFGAMISPAAYASLQAEFTDIEYEFPGFAIDDDGYAILAGLEGRISETVRVFGRVGYVSLEETDGPEFVVGGSAMFTENLGLVVEYRNTTLEDDAGDELDLTEIRAGLRLSL